MLNKPKCFDFPFIFKLLFVLGRVDNQGKVEQESADITVLADIIWKPSTFSILQEKSLKIFSVLIILTLFSCSQPPSNNAVHIVPLRTPPKTSNNTNKPPPPPPIQVYYLSSNFIIDSNGQVYYYGQQQNGWYCGTGIEWDTPPEFIGLKPSDIIKVPEQSVAKFIKLNILSQESNERSVAIASIKDTVVSSGLSTIIKLLSDTSNKVRWIFRKATQEEGTVLRFKQQNRKYHSNDVNWDSTKTLFPPNTYQVTKFSTPKVDEE